MPLLEHGDVGEKVPRLQTKSIVATNLRPDHLRLDTLETKINDLKTDIDVIDVKLKVTHRRLRMVLKRC
jgi:hypothetical protein